MKELSAAPDSKKFLQSWLTVCQKQRRGFSFAAIAKRGGFSSRSFVRQVLVGEKRLTLQSLPRFLKILNLDKNHERLLYLLLERDDESFNIQKRTRSEIEKEIKAVRTKISTKKRKKLSTENITTAAMKKIATLYPYLSADQGMKLEELCEKARISRVECQDLLRQLVQRGLVNETESLYRATERLIDVQEASKVDLVKSHLVAGIDQLKEHLYKEKTLSPDELFFRAEYTIDPSRLPEFKRQLRSLLVEFIESTESDDGKKIGRLVCAFY